MSEKVTYKELRNAVVHVDNSVDVSKTYEIAADVRLQGQNTVEAFESGTVAKDEVSIATFNCWGDAQNLGVNFTGVESNKQCEVIEAINTFMEDVKTKAGSYSGGELPVDEPTETEIVTQQLALSRMMINTMSLTDEQALEVKDLYPKWEELIGQEIAKDFRLTYEGKLYKALQQHTVQEQWKPGIDTASIYAVISASADEEHEGTKEDPIPYVQNMVLEKGKYYTQGGVLYLCIQGTITGYPNDLKDLASLVQKVEEESEL